LFGVRVGVVDIGGFVDHHCLNFLFIMYNLFDMTINVFSILTPLKINISF
jgi:hypothetical protein